MKILITGSAGFIGFSMSLRLLKKNNTVIGIDNLDDYYSLKLKKKELKYSKNIKILSFIRSISQIKRRFQFYQNINLI